MRKMGWLGLFIIIMLAGCSQRENNQWIYTGTIEAAQYDISGEVGGVIQTFYVDEGDRVKSGDMVVQLDDTSLNYAVLQQEAGYHAKQEQLKEIQKGAREEEIDIAVQELQTAQITLGAAKDQYSHQLGLYDATKKLWDEGAVNEQQLKDIKLQLDQMEANMKKAEKSVSIIQAKLEMLRKGATQELIQGSAYSAEQSKYGYEQAAVQREKAKVKTFQNGIVLYRFYHEGEFVSPGTPIITVMNPEDLWVKVYVPEKDIHRVKVGKKVSLLSDVLKEQKILGEIVFISPQAEFTPSSVTTKEDRHNRVHAVKVKVIEGMAHLNPGMVLDVNIAQQNTN